MSTALTASLRAYLIPVLGVAAMAGGILDLSAGIRAVLAYGRAVNPVPLTLEFTAGIAAFVIGVGSIAIGYRAVRHPRVVPLTMLSLMIAFLTWQVVVVILSFALPAPPSFDERITTATMLFVAVDIAAFVGAWFLFRALKRWLQEHRQRQRSTIGDGAA